MVASYLAWAIRNANAQLLGEIQERTDRQNRMHASAVNMYQSKISLLEKQNFSLLQDLKGVKKDLRQEILSFKQDLHNGGRRMPAQPEVRVGGGKKTSYVAVFGHLVFSNQLATRP